MNIVEDVRKLNLPQGEYLVLGSGILGALGIREIGDIDLLVSPSVFDKLRAEGWAYDEIEIEGQTREHLSRGEVEVYRDFWYGSNHPDPATLIADPQIIDSIPFLSLQKLAEIKKILARPKDLRDIELIDTYRLKKSWAGGFLYNRKDGTILLHHRDANTKINPDKWAFFGGLNEGSETFVECFVRELREEIGLSIRPEQAILLREYLNTDMGTYRVIFYVESDISASELVLGEGAGFEWVPIEKAFSYDLTEKTQDDLRYFVKMTGVGIELRLAK